MTKIDLGTWVSAVSGFLVAVLITMRDAMGRFLRAVRVSIVAFVASPAVWLAAFLAGGMSFWGGWWLGHSAGAHGKPDLIAQVALLKSAATKQELVRSELLRKLSDAETTIADLRKTEPAAAPRAPVVRRPVSKATQVEKAATAPPVAPWWPFDR